MPERFWQTTNELINTISSLFVFEAYQAISELGNLPPKFGSVSIDAISKLQQPINQTKKRKLQED